MTKKLLLALLLTIFAASLTLTFLILNLQEETGTDRVAINTIVKLTEQNWDKLDRTCTRKVLMNLPLSIPREYLNIRREMRFPLPLTKPSTIGIL